MEFRWTRTGAFMLYWIIAIPLILFLPLNYFTWKYIKEHMHTDKTLRSAQNYARNALRKFPNLRLTWMLPLAVGLWLLLPFFMFALVFFISIAFDPKEQEALQIRTYNNLGSLKVILLLIAVLSFSIFTIGIPQFLYYTLRTYFTMDYVYPLLRDDVDETRIETYFFWSQSTMIMFTLLGSPSLFSVLFLLAILYPALKEVLYDSFRSSSPKQISTHFNNNNFTTWFNYDPKKVEDFSWRNYFYLVLLRMKP